MWDLSALLNRHNGGHRPKNKGDDLIWTADSPPITIVPLSE